MSEVNRCPSCGRSTFACGGACTHEPVPLPIKSAPRWTPGSLADAMADAKQADAVERLTRAAMALVSAVESSRDRAQIWDHPEIDAALDVVLAAVEDTEKWGR